MSERLYSGSEVVAITKISPQIQNDWIRAGAVQAAQRGRIRGVGRENHFGLAGLAALGIIGRMRYRKVPLPLIATVTLALSQMSEEKFRSAAAKGLLLTGAGDALPPRLVSPLAVLANRTGTTQIVHTIDLAALLPVVEELVRRYDADADSRNTPALAG